MSSVLHLSETLYDWDKTDPSTHQVYFDDLHQHVIHQQPGNFRTVAIAKESEASDEVIVDFRVENLRLVRLSPDRSHFAFLCDKKRLGCLEVANPSGEPMKFTSKWARHDVEIHDFFWLPAVAGEVEGYADLVALTSSGVEIFRVTFAQRSIKSLKNFPCQVRTCWVEPRSGMALVCIGQRTLQPFDMRAKAPLKLPKFDLILNRNKVIEVNDVAVMTIYDSTFCIHCDGAQGRVSLRNISNPQQGTPEHDIVIDVMGENTPTGALRLSKVDNLLIVHCIEKNVSFLFDIRHKERNIVPSLCHASPLLKDLTSGETYSSEVWEQGLVRTAGSIVIDATSAGVRRLEVAVDGVLQELKFAGSPSDLSTMMKLLLRRTRCRENMVQTLRRSLKSKSSCTELAQAFTVLNQAYRQKIEVLSKRSPQSPGRQPSVSLNELEASFGQHSILSEKDMVALVFYPHFLASTAPLGEEGPFSVGAVSSDTWRIPLPESDAMDQVDGDQSRPLRSSYIVSVVIAYLRSLLSMQILPHKILQCFVFDICMHFHQEHTLQQLLHYHVLLDSTDLVLRLKNVSVKRGSSWATQSCLDMALRLHEHGIVADMLLLTKQYLDIVPFLINQQSTSFKLCALLQQIEVDTDISDDDPDLLEHVLMEIRMWKQEAQADTRIATPDLSGCEKWFPELRGEQTSQTEQIQRDHASN